ncbi:MAG TPA: hypothetical protein VHC70_11090, partial [Phycisphaerales bacterium]|nr:hypothetical protein [Phycisphaerales bacterium]
MRWCALVVVVLGCMCGCVASYVTPGAAADFRALGITAEAAAKQTDFPIAEKLARRPLAPFPATIAIVRVQGSGYCSHSERGYGQGRYSVVTARTVETDEHVKTMNALPMVRGVAPLNRLVLPDRLESEQDLRVAAASVQADMLLMYTFDTEFEVGTTIPFMGTITLGVFPNEKASVSTTASAALLDTRNGYIYALDEASAKDTQLANAWTSRDAVDECRKRTEQRAFDKLVGQFGGA